MYGFLTFLILISNQTSPSSGAGSQTVPFTARIILPNAEVRSGPGSDSKLYGTNNLKAGDIITVVQERADGWLAIRPPDGSFSWVQSKYLQRIVATQPNYLVQTNDGNKVPVYIGSAMLNTKPTLESARLARGTQVKSLGAEQSDGKENWIPIVPPENELRYIRCEAIGKQAVQANPAPAAVPAMTTNPGNQNTIVNANSAVPNCDPNQRWNQAISAESAGQSTEAIRLYTQIGQDFACSQPMFSSQSYGRAAWLRDCASKGKTNTIQACAPGQPKLTNKALVQAVSNSQNNAPTAPIATMVPQGNGPSPTPIKSINSGTGSGVGPGFLRKAGRPQGYEPSYYIESQQGRPLIYLVPAPGQNLDAFLNQRVEVSGPTTYRSDMRAYVMTAYQIQPK
ncbi:MAG: SH3 domain-containing protein [Planctomycetes bacterium]|nr:SH3 domain-containing protein [Planctomycetota bacterium]NBY01287.1 SH3 domain-containing protein [Planctomycetota bacterium]